MKNRFTLLFILFFFFQFINQETFAQMRQVYVDPVDNDNHLHKLSFYTLKEGYVAFTGWVGYTTDSGRTFTKKYITGGNVDYGPYSVNLTFGFGINGVKAFNQNTIIVYGHYGLVPSILYSTNGGNSFTLVYHSQYDQLNLRTGITDMVFPENNSIGYAVDADRVLKTTNQGLNWSVIRTDPASYFTYLEAPDNNTVFALSTTYEYNKLLKTSTGGSNWQPVNFPVLPAGKMSYANFISPTTGWLSITGDNNNRSIYKTTNGGDGWTLINNIEATPFVAVKMKFLDASTGFAISGMNQNTVCKTVDGGATWEPFARDNNYQYLNYSHADLQCISTSQLWAGGGHGLLELNTNANGSTLPRAYFLVDTTNLYATGNVNLVNYSRPGYTYKWFVNNVQISTAYNASYTHNSNHLQDTVKLVVSNGINSDTAVKYPNFSPPVIVNSFTPVTGGAGTVVTISGSNFYNVVSVSFGGVAASSFTVISTTSINAIVATGTSGDVKVTTATGSGTHAGFTFIPPPVINSFNPTTATAGTTITITGSNFNNVSAVSFAGIPATSYIVVSATTITAVAPSGTSGAVSVTTPGGTASLTGYVVQPIVDSFKPANGTQGTILHITGTSLTGATSVAVGGMNVLSFTVISSTSITAVIGTGNSGNVVVTTPAGNSSLPGFNWYPAPVITSFSPAAAAAGGSVVITGTGFNTVAASNIVYFGSVKATVTLASATSLTVTVPTGAANAPITVNNHNLTGYSPYPFLLTFLNGNSISPNSFASRTFANIGAERWPYDVFIADFDGDGKNDLAVLKYAQFTVDGGVSVFKNTSTVATVSFAAPLEISAGIQNMAIADMDGDGKLDIVLANGSIYRNTSSGGIISFTAETPFQSGNSIGQLVLADIDGDGKTDVVAGASEGTIVYRNLSEPGATAFAARIIISNTHSERNIVISDLNLDGKPDVILSNGAALKNTSTKGNIAFAAQVPISGYSFSYIAAGDIDGDGKPDIVSTDYSGSKIVVMRNTGTGDDISFASPLTFNANLNPVDIKINDMDGDGKADIAVVLGNYNLGMFKNTSTLGNISLGALTSYTAGSFVSEHMLALGDINGDGKNDAVVVSAGEQTVSVYTNAVKREPFIQSFTPTTGGLGTSVIITGTNFTNVTAVSFGSVPAASYTVNSSTSITAIVGSGATGNVSVTNNFGTASLAGYVFSLPPVITSFSPAEAAVGATITIIGNNFDPVAANNIVYFGKIKAKVPAATASTLTVTIPFGSVHDVISVTSTSTGLTGYSAPAFVTTFPNGNGITTASFAPRVDVAPGRNFSDIDGDGKLDFISTSTSSICVSKNISVSGNVSFAASVCFTTASSPGKLAAGDLDGDGKPDIAIACGTNTVSVLLNTTASQGSISFASKIDLSTSITTANPNYIQIKDLDGDGKPELVVSNYTVQTLSIYKNKSTPGNLSFEARSDYALSYYPNEILLNDIDGDNKPEVIVQNEVFRNTSLSGTISFAPKTTYADFTGSVTMTDIDKDGKLDVCVFSADSISIFRNVSTTGNILFSPKISYRVATSLYRRIIANDLDGDGKPDLVTNSYDSSSVTVFNNKSTPGNISFLNGIPYTVSGAASDVYSCDVDNDGKADIIAFYGGATSTVLRNQSGGSGPSISSFAPVNAVSGTAVTITGNNFRNATEVSFGNIAATSFIIESDNIITAIVGTGASGDVIVKSASGMGSLTGFKYSTAPSITAVLPSILKAGATVSITGANLNGVTAVSFGGIPVTSFTLNSPTNITAVLAANSLPGSAKVNTASDSAIYSNFSFYRKPVINSITPAGGSTTQTITIKGVGFTGTSSVYFGKIEAASFSIVDDSTITAVIGIGESGSITVNTPGGKASINDFIYYAPSAPPSFTSFTPASATAGSPVYITGTNLTRVYTVQFGGIPARSFTVNSSTSITAIVDTGLSGSVFISNPNGNRSLAGFTYIPTTIPYLVNVAPSIVVPGTVVNITGMNFSNVSAVSFGGVAANSFTINSATSITAIVGAGASGNVVVSSPGGNDTLAGLVFTTVPFIKSFSPRSASPGSIVAITGANFSNIADSNIVYFGAVRATSILSASANTLIVTVPIGATFAPISITRAGFSGYSNSPFIPGFTAAGPINPNSFSARFDSATGKSPGWITLFDMDGDGKVDICSADNATSTTASTTAYRNNSFPGTISLASSTRITTGFTLPIKNYFADFDGDGKLDLATSTQGDAFSISVAKNNSSPGSLSFDAPVKASASLGPFQATVADLDGDGRPDMATTGIYSGVAVYRNTSTATAISFAARVNFSYPTNPGSITSEDIDRDGKPELIVTGGTLIVLHNTSVPGTLSFTTAADISNIGGTVTTCDIDGDGLPDIIARGAGGISVLRNISTPGNIQFETRVDISPGFSAPTSINFADMDGNGKVDIIACRDANTVSVFINKSTPGNIVIEDRIDYATSAPGIANAADIDGDGKPDIVASNTKSNSVSVLRNLMTSDASKMEVCPGGNISLNADVTSNNFQWQVNNGAGYINLTDNATVTGTNSSTLQLSNLPSAWYGYSFRCRAGNKYSQAFRLRFVSYWTGAVNSAWETPGNWSCNKLPDANTDLIIYKGPIILSSHGFCRSVNVLPGVSLTITPGNILTVAQ